MPLHPSMYCQVFLNGEDITDKVISYEREHKICSGIGMINLQVTNALRDQIGTWDNIIIWENLGKEGSYFVNQVDDSAPTGVITVIAQDNSKRLSDYFIAETYYIDYPTYTRTWIEFFLAEMDIEYEFMTDSYGSLLSNDTQLGLMSGYEQIMQLLQISGWFIYFTPADKAIIGKLDEVLNSKCEFNNNNTIEVKVVTHDKMLRNRVVVWGKNHPVIGWITGEAKRITGWNYDNLDYRTMVISNANIPTISAASDLATKALAEFTKPNREIYVTAKGIYGINVGNFVTVHFGGGVWNGKGMVTTFGTSMSKGGLVTKVILNERCPRLFAFFNLGDYVYISTAESGVWRKRFQYNNLWENFSTGLDEGKITDLHVSAGVLASVTGSGHGFACIADYSGWSQIPLSGLMDLDISTSSGTFVTSGLMARACIVDKMSNYAKYAIDTAPWENPIFYESYPSGLADQIFQSGGNGILLNGSGFVMDDMRSWVVTYDSFSGYIVSERQVTVLTSGIMPVLSETASGVSKSVIVFDIENDGVRDFLSAMVVGPGVYSYATSPSNFGYDVHNKVTLSGFTVIDRYPFTMGETFSGVVIGSGLQFVKTLKSPPGYPFLPYKMAGFPQLTNGIYQQVYDRVDNPYVPNGPWDVQFYTINGNPSMIYADANGLTVIEMPAIQTPTSGYMITPKTTIITGAGTSGEILGTVKISDTQIDVVYALREPDILRDTYRTGLYYNRVDIVTQEVLEYGTWFGWIERRWPTDMYSAETSRTKQQSAINQLRVGDFVYFLTYRLEGLIDDPVLPTDYIGLFYLEVVDLVAKTSKRSLLGTYSEPTIVLGPYTLYQLKDKVGLIYLEGINDGSVAYKYTAYNSRIYKTEFAIGELPGGAKMEISCDWGEYKATGTTSINMLSTIVYPSYGTYASPIYYRLNPNVLNFIVKDFAIYSIYDPDIGWVEVSHLKRICGMLDGKAFFEVEELPYETPVPEVTLWKQAPESTFNRIQMIGNPNQYFGYGYMQDTLLAGYTEGATFDVMHTFDSIPSDWERITIFNSQDSLSSGVYALMRSDRYEYEVWEFREDGTTITGVPFYGLPSGWRSNTDSTTYTYAFNALNFFVVIPYKASLSYRTNMAINYYYSPYLMSGYTFATLQDTLSGEFAVLNYYDKVPRLDISKYAPLLVATDTVGSIQTVYASSSTTDIIMPSLITSSGSDERLRDYRYSDFSISGVSSGIYTEDGETPSGLLTERRILFASPSGLYYAPIDNINDSYLYSGFNGITQIEVTNNNYDYQYIFVATSGDDSVIRFYQRDNIVSGYFYECSGVPQSYITRVRVDDLV